MSCHVFQAIWGISCVGNQLFRGTGLILNAIEDVGGRIAPMLSLSFCYFSPHGTWEVQGVWQGAIHRLAMSRPV